jgi:hypothetical protein
VAFRACAGWLDDFRIAAGQVPFRACTGWLDFRTAAGRVPFRIRADGVSF